MRNILNRDDLMTKDDQRKFNDYMNNHMDEINKDLLNRAKKYGLKISK